MAQNKLLAEWFWTDRWMGSSGFLLPLEARGLYREMLTQAWRRGARLPSDHAAIRRACGATEEEWARCWPLVGRYWVVDGDTIFNETQVEVYKDAENRARSNEERAKTAARARWNAQAFPQAKPKQCPPSPSPSPSPTPIKEPEPPTPGEDRPPPGVGPSGAKRAVPPRRRLALDLGHLLGSGVKPCEDQIRALENAGWSHDRIREAIGKALPGMSPWEWTRVVTNHNGAKEGSRPLSVAEILEAGRNAQ